MILFAFFISMIVLPAFFFLFVTIPILLFVVSSKSQKVETKSINIIGKLLLSLFAHFVISIIVILFLLFIYVSPEPRPVEKMGETEKIFSLLIVVGYGFAGWLLCSFVNGGYVNFVDLFTFKKEKPLSVFDED